MSLLGAVAFDFAEQLKRKTKTWSVTPLVTGGFVFPRNGGLLFVKPTPNNKSPFQHYAENPPTANHTFLQVKQPKHPLRLIGLCLEAETKCTINLSFWRANGFVKREMSVKDFRYARTQLYTECPDGYNSLILCRMHHVTRTNKKKEVNWHSFDLTVPEPPAHIIDLTIAIIGKSYQWLGRGKYEKFGSFQYPVMIDLNGKNYTIDGRSCGNWLA